MVGVELLVVRKFFSAQYLMTYALFIRPVIEVDAGIGCFSVGHVSNISTLNGNQDALTNGIRFIRRAALCIYTIHLTHPILNLLIVEVYLGGDLRKAPRPVASRKPL